MFLDLVLFQIMGHEWNLLILFHDDIVNVISTVLYKININECIKKKYYCIFFIKFNFLPHLKNPH